MSHELVKRQSENSNSLENTNKSSGFSLAPPTRERSSALVSEPDLSINTFDPSNDTLQTQEKSGNENSDSLFPDNELNFDEMVAFYFKKFKNLGDARSRKKLFNNYSRTLHPDKSQDTDTTDSFIAMKEAYEKVLNPEVFTLENPELETESVLLLNNEPESGDITESTTEQTSEEDQITKVEDILGYLGLLKIIKGQLEELGIEPSKMSKVEKQQKIAEDSKNLFKLAMEQLKNKRIELKFQKWYRELKEYKLDRIIEDYNIEDKYEAEKKNEPPLNDLMEIIDNDKHPELREALTVTFYKLNLNQKESNKESKNPLEQLISKLYIHWNLARAYMPNGVYFRMNATIRNRKILKNIFDWELSYSKLIQHKNGLANTSFPVTEESTKPLGFMLTQINDLIAMAPSRRRSNAITERSITPFSIEETTPTPETQPLAMVPFKP